MSTDAACMALRLRGPIQAWGVDSQFNRRNTGLMPTRSAIIGMCCAAMGLARGSTEESAVLKEFLDTRFLIIAIAVPGRHGKSLDVRRIQDYHTVQGTKTADGKIKGTHLTYRQYLCDADFRVAINGNHGFMQKVAEALDNPVWGIWLGRKACIPSAPVLVPSSSGYLFASEEEALTVLLSGRPLEEFTYQRDVDNFADGGDSLPDVPLSFDTSARKFSIRRVKISINRSIIESSEYFME